MQPFQQLVNNFRQDDQHGKHIRLLLVASYTIIFCIMLGAMAVTYKSGTDIISLGTKNHQISHPITLQIINLKLAINESNRLINTWLAKPNTEIFKAYKQANQQLNAELKKLLDLTHTPSRFSHLLKKIKDNQIIIEQAQHTEKKSEHWENSHLIIQNFIAINSLINQLIREQTLTSHENNQQVYIKLSQIIKANIGTMLFTLLFGLLLIFKINKHVVSLLNELKRNKEDADHAKSVAELKTVELDNTSRVLIKTNRNLIDSIENLKNTRDQLVQNEKMASLGELVAGIAHEVNTPMGIGVTAASHLQDLVAIFTQKFESGKITKTEFSDFLNDANEVTHILLTNLERGAKLISSFKQIAVDQTSEDRRLFNLKNTVEETLLSLHPKIKQTKISVDITCPENIELDSYPGSYSQVISNLVTNSLIHAYDKNDSGKIGIQISTTAQELSIRYCDDGKGIAEENKKKVFDPFFTTRRGSGGSGLGLNLIFNIITQQLKGEINIQDNTQSTTTGTCFDIKLPLSLP